MKKDADKKEANERLKDAAAAETRCVAMCSRSSVAGAASEAETADDETAAVVMLCL